MAFVSIHVRFDEAQKTKPPWFPTRVLEKAGDNLLSRYSHYHGPQVLNGRVRNGNGCGHLGMVTGKSNQWLVVSGQWLVNQGHATITG